MQDPLPCAYPTYPIVETSHSISMSIPTDAVDDQKMTDTANHVEYCIRTRRKRKVGYKETIVAGNHVLEFELVEKDAPFQPFTYTGPDGKKFSSAV